MKIVLFFLFCLMMFGCTSKSFDPHPYALSYSEQGSHLTETADFATVTADLLCDDWLASGSVFRVRFAMHYVEENVPFDFEGLLRIQTASYTGSIEEGVATRKEPAVRVVLFSELGAKLFDVSITADDTTVHVSLPGRGVRHIQENIVTCLRRMLVGYQPHLGDTYNAQSEKLTLSRYEKPVFLKNIFGHPAPLSSITGESDDQSLHSVRSRTELMSSEALVWYAQYGAYQLVGRWLVPARLEYQDVYGLSGRDKSAKWAEEKGKSSNLHITLTFVAVREGK